MPLRILTFSKVYLLTLLGKPRINVWWSARSGWLRVRQVPSYLKESADAYVYVCADCGDYGFGPRDGI